jgi:S1-C subfamily serine protease
VTRVDWIALAIAALSALSGLRRGLVATALSLGGLAAGAVVGARLAPQFLSGGASSPYTPLAGLVGAVVGALLLQTVASIVGSVARGSLSVIPPLRALDSLGGLAAGAALGLALVWVAGSVLLQLPGQTKLRQEVQQSVILRRLNEIAPPRTVLRAWARFDPFPQFAGPAPPSTPPNRTVLSSAGVRKAEPSVVRVTADACGLGVEGSGFFVGPNLIVTAAHVVAGATNIEVDGVDATVRAFDKTQDVAVLRRRFLGTEPPLLLAEPRAGDDVAILGYPENGPFDARPGRVGTTAEVLLNGRLREVTAISGLVRHGNSGGPVVNGNGQVEGMVFAARVTGGGGYAVPPDVIRSVLAHAKPRVSTGSC